MAVEGKCERRNNSGTIQGITNQISSHRIITNRNRQEMQTLKQFDETVEHIISPCSALANEQYIDMIECVLNYTLTYAKE
jgi:hypothetical protein